MLPIAFQFALIVTTIKCFPQVQISGDIFNKTTTKLPIAFVYTVVPAVCSHGLPRYIRESVEQAIVTQPEFEVIMASNYVECAAIAHTVQNMKNLMQVDTTRIVSNRTNLFRNVSHGIFQRDNFGELWITSALRFFIIEDLMIANGYDELIHVEADNLLYGDYLSLLPILRSGYKGLAATPLNANKSFITASVFWISNLISLVKFNNFLLELGCNKDDLFKKYLKWLRNYACCKPGGIDPDSSGSGIKPFAVNEMSMLGYYHSLFPSEFHLFPVVPAHQYVLNKYVCNMSIFGPGGPEVGPPTLDGIWDSNSWGQFIGGTHSKHGRDKGFTDASHISGQAIRMTGCEVKFLCGNQTNSHSKIYNNSSNNHEQSNSNSIYHSLTRGCYTAPFVKCGTSNTTSWTPLWNLHVHSKHTMDFRSIPCPCP
eukprot:gene11925-15958_t